MLRAHTPAITLYEPSILYPFPCSRLARVLLPPPRGIRESSRFWLGKIEEGFVFATNAPQNSPSSTRFQIVSHLLLRLKSEKKLSNFAMLEEF